MKLERVLIVDVETTGLDRVKDKVIEVAGVLVDIAEAEIAACWSTLFHAEENAAERINGIGVSLLRRWPNEPPEHGWSEIARLAGRADAIVAHRAVFDRSIVPPQITHDVPWICSKFGIDWPRGQWGGHLTDLSLAHGVTITANHRALDDCLLLARVMKRAAEISGGSNLVAVEEPRTLRGMLRRGVERGVGEPNRCRFPWTIATPVEGDRDRAPWEYVAGPMPGVERIGSFKDQCTKWVRSYRPDVFYCPAHGGSSEWTP